MQREILFRGKRVDNGEWIYGYYAYDTEWAKGYILSQQKKGVFFQLGTTEVTPESAGQFTGLKDKNDNKIFEDDILQDNNEYTYIAYWNGTLSGKTKQGYHIGCDIPNRVNENYTVIGNLHDNPDLYDNPPNTKQPCP